MESYIIIAENAEAVPSQNVRQSLHRHTSVIVIARRILIEITQTSQNNAKLVIWQSKITHILSKIKYKFTNKIHEIHLLAGFCNPVVLNFRAHSIYHLHLNISDRNDHSFSLSLPFTLLLEPSQY